MMKKSIILLILAALLPISCNKGLPQGESRLVVEGWIENGGHPMVLVSESFAIEVGKEISTSDLLESLAKWARVTVSDGDTSIILTGVVDPEYFPPYVFTTSNMTGEVGKSYDLRVEYKDYVATARTTIPEPVPLDTVYLASVKDSLCHVVCGFTDPPRKGNYYKFFTRTTGKDSHYHSSALALTDDADLNGYTEMFLYSTLRLMDFIAMPNICQGDELWVKLCTLNQEEFLFWKDYESILYANLFNAQTSAQKRGNVQGALGYWAGYGVDQPVCIQLDGPSDSE